jgi:4'-phosphopantetheinyl transferase
MPKSNSLWSPPPANLHLRGDEVHVWQASLDVPLQLVETLQKTLSNDELKRAARLHTPDIRARFIVARARLRAILGRYLEVEPRLLHFVYGGEGKPALGSEFEHHSLQFNLSHSDRVALYAIAQNRNVGIDVERVRSNIPFETIIHRFFSSLERRALQALPRSNREKAFFHFWTCKEAYIKARGKGLSLPLTGFSVSIQPDGGALVAQQDEPEETTRWTLQVLPMDSYDFVGALAVEGSAWTLRYWLWPQ